MKKILDACCGSRMFWFDKENENVLYMDKRKIIRSFKDGRTVEVCPDVIGDFRNMEFEDASFHLVVFDPPHLLRAGETSWLATKYGVLDSKTWKEDIKQGFKECMRVLKVNGVLVFKWSEHQVSVKDVLQLFEHKPLFGTRRGKGIFLVFMK